MCNLYNITSTRDAARQLRKLLVLDSVPDGIMWREDVFESAFDRPLMPIVAGAEKVLTLANWSLIPPWVKPDDEEALSKQPIYGRNAKSETMFELKTFAPYAATQRCLVLATKFKEFHWEDSKGKTKTPYKIGLESGESFFFGGLYSIWNGGYTFTICTKKPNKLMKFIHNNVRDFSGAVEPRMPVIVPEDAWERWLTPSPKEAIEDLFIPHDDDGLVAESERRQYELF